MYKTMKRSLITISFLLLTSCLVNPVNYYVVESTHDVAIVDIKPDVITTSTYKKYKNRIKTIAVRAPEVCSNDSLKSNSSIKTDAVLSSKCGQAMSVLERELVKNGYRVISWKVIASRSENKAALELAKLHKAELLLQINSLDRTIDVTDKSSKWTDTFYNADTRGNKQDIATVGSEQAKAMLDNSLTKAQTKERASIFGEQPGASIDVTATLVKNAESVWFYKWTKLEKNNEMHKTKMVSYVKCNNSKCWQWPHNYKPRNKTKDQRFITGSSNTIETAQYTNASNRMYQKLLKDVIKDMVTQLKR